MRRLGSPLFFSLAIVALRLCQIHAIYVPWREYAGSTAVAAQLTYVNSAGNAIIRVDNTMNIAPAPLVYRNSVRLTTKDVYGVGTLSVIDVLHLPFGCSVWPSFWSLGANILWPNGGEIDIIEGINFQTNNQAALHTTYGCFAAPNATQRQSGPLLETDCSVARGCLTAEAKPNSYGQAFANAGGRVWALQMDVTGVYAWYWGRPDVPVSISSATSTSNLDTSTFGMPTAS